MLDRRCHHDATAAIKPSRKALSSSSYIEKGRLCAQARESTARALALEIDDRARGLVSDHRTTRTVRDIPALLLCRHSGLPGLLFPWLFPGDVSL